MEKVLSSFEDYIRQRIVTDCVTLKTTLREELMTMTNGSRGCSVRSIENFCKIKGIHKSSRLSTERVKEIVAEAIIKVLFLLS